MRPEQGYEENCFSVSDEGEDVSEQSAPKSSPARLSAMREHRETLSNILALDRHLLLQRDQREDDPSE